ncbi:hypothetical protein LPJ56_003530 [Coemansia sp. RSA 2599]|nr:hypothetical protein LPJ56_003530 [Coemansia sp. RSA 2599]
MNLLTKYFAQPRECNLALTGVLAALVGCPHRTLDLWLGFNLGSLLNGVLSKPWALWMDNLRSISDDELSGDSSDSEGETDPRAVSSKLGGAPAAAIASANASKYAGLDRELQAAVRALPSGATAPSLYLVISGLVQQAKVLRNEIPDFSRRLKRARNALMGVVEDADDLDEELESTGSRHRQSAAQGSVADHDRSRNRDRGLSSASLESARGSLLLETAGHTPSSPSSARRNRSPSSATATSLAMSAMTPVLLSVRPRSGSASHTSDMASSSSVSTGANNGARSAIHASAAGSSMGDASLAGASWHALSTPPANANIAEFLENVIILQESIKEIIARVQVRRENGGDEDAFVQ